MAGFKHWRQGSFSPAVLLEHPTETQSYDAHVRRCTEVVENVRIPNMVAAHPTRHIEKGFFTSRQCVSQRHRATAEPRIGGLAEGPTVTPRSLAFEPL